MFGYVSTKNLYLVMMQPVRRIDYDDYWTNHLYFGDDRIYAFARKKTDRTYIDLFTDTEYKRHDNYGVNAGDYVVRSATPVVTEHKRIPLSVLKEMLVEINQDSLSTIPKQKVK